MRGRVVVTGPEQCPRMVKGGGITAQRRATGGVRGGGDAPRVNKVVNAFMKVETVESTSHVRPQRHHQNKCRRVAGVWYAAVRWQ